MIGQLQQQILFSKFLFMIMIYDLENLWFRKFLEKIRVILLVVIFLDVERSKITFKSAINIGKIPDNWWNT